MGCSIVVHMIATYDDLEALEAFCLLYKMLTNMMVVYTMIYFSMMLCI